MKSRMIFSLALLGMCFNVFAIQKGVYGSDDRKDLYEVTNPLFQQLARSTAAMIDSSDITKVSGGYRLRAKTLASEGICKSARFANQITAASCSGFLIAPDLMVTAGHCVNHYYDCVYNYWVFDYAVFKPGQDGTAIIPQENVYRCDDIISSTYNKVNDYSLIKLRRSVIGRQPLKFRKSGKVRSGTKLVIIGHPTGLPLKIADNAKVKKNSHHDYFVANLDSFAGNSGSAVFDAKTGQVEGILVRGDRDYEWVNDSNGTHCKVPSKCSDYVGIFSKCMGEDSTRITNIEEILNL